MPVLVYLNFDGNCRDALEFYRSVFGGEYMMITTFGEGPDDIGIADSDKDKIMHATLMIGDGVIMASDTPSRTSALPCRWATTSRSRTRRRARRRPMSSSPRYRRAGR